MPLENRGVNTLEVLLAIGSNLSNPVQQVRKAINAVASHPDFELIRAASLYSSSPQGPQDQDDYVNTAVLIRTALDPLALLSATQAIETAFGRIKTRKWGERIIDIDIVFYGREKILHTLPDLCIPHREALTRDFVLVPCIEAAPDWRHPDGSLLTDHLEASIQHDLVQIDLNLACS